MLGLLQTKTVTAPNGQKATLTSIDGKTWAKKPATLLAFTTRKADIAYLNDDQKRWLDLVELPVGYDVRNAVRMGGVA